MNSKKIIALFLACSLVFSIMLVGCGQKADDITSIKDDTGTKAAVNETKAEEKKAEAKSEVKVSGEKKKIVVLQEATDPFYDQCNANIIKTLEKGGYNAQNAEITQLKMFGEQKKSPEEVVNIVKDMKPDVFALTIGPTCNNAVVKLLEGSGIPLLTESGDAFWDSNGKPKGNVTGIYNMPADLQLNAFKLLDKISPIKGKKAVFLTIDGFFSKEKVADSLKKATGTDLKEYVIVDNIDDWEAAIKKYNEDSEVSWLLLGVVPGKRKDGTGSQLESIQWSVANVRKPGVTYWDTAIQLGFLCGLGVDIPEQGTQVGEMAVRILNGEKVENIKALEPRKINIVLNQKNAEQLGIHFPAEIMGSAYRIYTDYEGHFKQGN